MSAAAEASRKNKRPTSFLASIFWPDKSSLLVVTLQTWADREGDFMEEEKKTRNKN